MTSSIFIHILAHFFSVLSLIVLQIPLLVCVVCVFVLTKLYQNHGDMLLKVFQK